MFFISLLPLFAQESGMTPEQALKRLMNGNERYVKDALLHPNRTEERRQALVSHQEPFAVIVGCSDSRVAPEIIFDEGVGDLFVVRVAGNVIGPIELESIEFGVFNLHSSVILVLGHENCGAVNAVVQGTTKSIPEIASLIKPAVESAKSSHPANLLEASIKANALRMKALLLKDPEIKKLVEKNKLSVQAGYYNLSSGKVELL